MLHKNWDRATEEQQTRIEFMKLQIERTKNANGNDDDGVVIINDAPEETG